MNCRKCGSDRFVNESRAPFGMSFNCLTCGNRESIGLAHALRYFVTVVDSDYEDSDVVKSRMGAELLKDDYHSMGYKDVRITLGAPEWAS